MTISNLGQPDQKVFTDEEGRYSLRGVAPDVEFVVKATKQGYRDTKSEEVTNWLHVTAAAPCACCSSLKVTSPAIDWPMSARTKSTAKKMLSECWRMRMPIIAPRAR